jgi:dTDP-4-dehydrorhamnose reductase
MIQIVGSKGFLGSELSKFLPPVSKNIVINCAGKSSLEYCEENPEQSLESNLNLVKRLASERPHLLIHFSSYYVYDDAPICSELANTTRAYQYCKHKLESEQVVLEAKGIVFRIGKLFGKELQPGKLFDYIATSKGTMTLDRVLFNPTSNSLIKKICLDVIFNNTLPSDVYNLGCDNPASAIDIAKHYGKDSYIRAIDKIEKPFHNYGRFLMDLSKIKSYYTSLPTWEEELWRYSQSER